MTIKNYRPFGFIALLGMTSLGVYSQGYASEINPSMAEEMASMSAPMGGMSSASHAKPTERGESASWTHSLPSFPTMSGEEADDSRGYYNRYGRGGYPGPWSGGPFNPMMMPPPWLMGNGPYPGGWGGTPPGYGWNSPPPPSSQNMPPQGVGNGSGGIMAILEMLGLDEDQRGVALQLMQEVQQKRMMTQAKVTEQKAKLMELYQAEPRDVAAIGKAYGEMFEAKRKLIEGSIDALNRFENQLKGPQKKMMRQFLMSSGALMMNE